MSVELVARALRALGGPLFAVDSVPVALISRPGLYAIHGSASTWNELDLGMPPDDRPLYVGKAESTLASRDLEVHFGGRERGVQSPTGSSTVRRSLAALLAPKHGFAGMPRNPAKPGYFSNFGLSTEHDDDLSAWMRAVLLLALWPHDDVGILDAIETAVLIDLLPPLNLGKVTTPWREQVKTSRKRLAREARTWGPSGHT